MNTQTFTKLMLGAVLAGSLIGCSKGNQTATVTGLVPGTTGTVDNSGNPYVPGVTTPTASTGNTVAFNPISTSEYNNFIAITSLYSPSDFKVSINLKDRGGLLYAGSVSMTYNDNGRTVSRTFSADSGTVPSLNNGWGMTNGNDVGSPIAKYNYWFSYGGKTVFNGFYQDSIGAIVLVIDNVGASNDGATGTTLSGHIYYKNFSLNQFPQGPARNCWFIYNNYTNYDCRSLTVINKTHVYPDMNYIYLGSFSGISRAKAFQ